MSSVLIYDLEIIHCIPTREPRQANFSYCGGWRDFEGMGISCAAYTWLDSDEPPIVFEWKDSFDRQSFVAALVKADIVCGFNSVNFDDRLLAANGVYCHTNYDLLLECRLAAYDSFDYRAQPRGHTLSLDSICKANGLEKTGHGALAPQWWQAGRRQDVLEYAQNDAAITKAALALAVRGKKVEKDGQLRIAGSLVNPNTGEPFVVRPLSMALNINSY